MADEQSGGAHTDRDPASGGAVRATLASCPVWAHFTNPPALGGRDPTILTEFQRLVNNAPAGSTIRCAIHNVTRFDPADALVRARDRGVNVKVVADGNVAASARAGAVRLRDLGKDVRFCTDNIGGGCVTTNVGNMHAKLLTLTKTTDPNGMVRHAACWFGSPNLTGATGMDSFNDAITVYEDARLHAGFGRYFDELWNANHYPSNDFYRRAAKRGYYRGVTGTIFASPAQRVDLVRSRLNDLRPTSSCRIRVAEAQFTDGRRQLADLLAAQKRGGCCVWVIVGLNTDGGPMIGTTVRQTLKDAGIPIRQQRIHSKFVLVAASISGEFRRQIYTGSHNWTHSANYDNDEIFVRMLAETGARRPLYHAYRRQFGEAYDLATPL